MAKEHFATPVTRSLMARPSPSAVPDAGNGRRVVADFFEMAGYEPISLGAHTPETGIVQAVVDLRPDLLLISVAMVAHLPAGGAIGLFLSRRSSTDEMAGPSSTNEMRPGCY